MKARSRSLVTTLVFLAVAGAAVAAAYFGVEKRDQSAAAQKAAGEKIYGFAGSRVKALTVQAKGDVTKLVKNDKAAGDKPGDTWMVESPSPGPAESATVVPIVNRLAELQRKASVAPTTDAATLRKYGLEHPATKVTLTLDDGKVETFALGDENAFDNTVFVQSTSGAIDLVAGDVKYPLEKTTFDLRDKRLLPFDEKDLGRIEVTTPKLSYVLNRAPDAWKVESPVKDTVDETAIDKVRGGIRSLNATAFVHEGKPDVAYGLDHPRWKVKMVSPSGVTRSLVVGEVSTSPAAPKTKPKKGAKAEQPAEPATPPQLYGRIEGSAEIVTLGPDAMKDFNQELFQLRDKKLLHFDVSKVATAKFTVGGTSFEGKPEGSPKVLNAIRNLTYLQAIAFADETGKAQAAYGLDHPTTQVVLLDAAGKEIDSFRAAQRNGKTYAQGSIVPRIVELSPSALVSLPQKAEDLKEPTASAPPAAAPNATAAK